MRIVAKIAVVAVGLCLVAFISFVAQSMAIESRHPKPARADTTCHTFENGEGGGWICERPKSDS